MPLSDINDFLATYTKKDLIDLTSDLDYIAEASANYAALVDHIQFQGLTADPENGAIFSFAGHKQQKYVISNVSNGECDLTPALVQSVVQGESIIITNAVNMTVYNQQRDMSDEEIYSMIRGRYKDISAWPTAPILLKECSVDLTYHRLRKRRRLNTEQDDFYYRMTMKKVEGVANELLKLDSVSEEQHDKNVLTSDRFESGRTVWTDQRLKGFR